MIDVVARTADQVFIPLTVGGGIRSVEDMRRMLRAGADKISINSAALADPELIDRGAYAFGSQCIVLAIDARRARRMAATRSTRTAAGARPGAMPWPGRSRWWVAAPGEILLTSMDADGTKDGFELTLTAAVSDAVPVPVIASGGAGHAGHMAEALTIGQGRRGAGRQHLPLRRADIDQVKRSWRGAASRCGCAGKRRLRPVNGGGYCDSSRHASRSCATTTVAWSRRWCRTPAMVRC